MSSAVVAAALLWVAVAVRSPTLTRSTTQRYLFVALVALAVGVTLDVPQVAARVLEVTGTGPNVPHLAKHLMVVLAAGAVWEVVRAIGLSPHEAPTHRVHRALATVGALGVLGVMFARAPVHDGPLPGLTVAAVGEPTLLVYWAGYLAALSAALVGVVRVVFNASRTFPASPVLSGMLWMGAGSVLGLVYCAHKAYFLVTANSGIIAHDSDTMDTVQSVLLAATVLTFVTGLLWPFIIRWPVLRHLIAYRAYRRLHSLWQAYVEAEPAIAFNDTGRPRLRDIELRLYRRAIEIRDGMLAVRPYAGGRIREVALREARSAGGKNPDLVGEAAWLEIARRNKLRGDPPCQDNVPTTTGGADLASEARELTTVAKEWPTVQAVADDVEGLTRAGTSSR